VIGNLASSRNLVDVDPLSGLHMGDLIRLKSELKADIVCQVLFPVPKHRIFAKLGFVGTLTKTFECNFGDLIQNLAIFQTF
jgi:hypothetical protein